MSEAQLGRLLDRQEPAALGNRTLMVLALIRQVHGADRHVDMLELAITSAYLRGIDSTEIIHAVHKRPAPMIPPPNAPH